MIWDVYQCILNVPLWNDWSKATYSQVLGSPMLKALSFESLNWISATRFAKLIQNLDSTFRIPRAFWRKNFSVSLERNFILYKGQGHRSDCWCHLSNIMPDSISSDNWEVGENFRFFFFFKGSWHYVWQ